MVWIAIGKCIFSCYSSWRLRKAQRKLDRIKLNNYRESQGLSPIYTFCERISRWFSGLFSPCMNKSKQCFCPCFIDYSRFDEEDLSFYQKIWINGFKENYIAKSLAGFIAGVLLSVILWNSIHADPLTLPTSLADAKDLDVQRKTSIIANFVIIITGLCVTYALTFSEASRCVFVLGLLQFFTNKGRAALLAYTLILALSGPSRNSVTNMEILTESLACGQNLLKDSVLDLFSFVSQPFTSFQRAIGHIINSLQGVFGRMQDELEAVVEAVKDIGYLKVTISVIRSVYAKLTNIVDTCNNEFGTPYQRCLNSFDAATESCQTELGSSLAWMCSPVDIFNFLCSFAKVSDVIMCWIPSLVNRHIFQPIVEQFRTFTDEFKKFFDARLNITYKLDHDLIRDKTISQVVEGMKNEILGRCSWIFQYIGWMDMTLLISVSIVIFKATSYRWKFLYSDMYDNYYLSSSLIQMDTRRLAAGGESIFPLRNREANIYVETTSWRLVKEERKDRKLALALVFIASVQILSYVFIDLMLFKLMEWIRLNAAVEYKTWSDSALGVTATVEGDGFLATMYRNILDNLDPINFVLPRLNTTACLPMANKPCYKTYFKIVLLLLVCFSLAFFEPYGLRMRHLICGWVYPHRVFERERWLYVHILTTRDSFIQFAKRKVREKIGFKISKNWKNKNTRNFQVSCKERLIHRAPFLAYLFDPTTIKCFICGSRGKHDDRESFIDCLKCSTIYCRKCLEDMYDRCVICNTRMNADAGSEIDDSELEQEDFDDEVKQKQVLNDDDEYMIEHYT